MTTPGKLTIDHATGKLQSPDGSIKISYASPFPIPFCAGPNVTGTMRGIVEHTTVGYFQSAVDMFESKANKSGSAHLLVGTLGAHDGELMQFVPIGKGFETFHAYAANSEFYGIETEDGGKPSTPISDAGLWTWAAAAEFLSDFANFPLQLLTRYRGQGIGYHRQFFAWNRSLHSCPGASFTDNVRRDQRAEIVRRAHLIRDQNGGVTTVKAPAQTWTNVTPHVAVQSHLHDVVLDVKRTP